MEMPHMNSHNPNTTPFPLHLLHFHCPLPIPPMVLMKIVYNQGGFNSAYHIQRYESGFGGHRTRCSNAEKMNILCVVEKLQSEQHLNLAQAAAFVQMNPLLIYKWLKIKEFQSDPNNPQKASKMSLHPGLTSLVMDIEEGLLKFI
jgi:hypothetical protein